TAAPRRGFDLRRILVLADPAEAPRHRPWVEAPGSAIRSGRPSPQAVVARVHGRRARRRTWREPRGTPKARASRREPPWLRGGVDASDRSHSSVQRSLVRRTPTLTGRGERMRASRPVERVVRRLTTTEQPR